MNFNSSIKKLIGALNDSICACLYYKETSALLTLPVSAFTILLWIGFTRIITAILIRTQQSTTFETNVQLDLSFMALYGTMEKAWAYTITWHGIIIRTTHMPF